MVFLREREFSRDQPCETRLLARLESHMVSWETFAEVVGTRRVLGERHVLYLTSYVRTKQVWSQMSRETGLARWDHGLVVSSRISSHKVSQRDATLVSLPSPLPVSVNYWHCSVGISVSVLRFCQNSTIGYFLCTIWREHLLKIWRELFFWKFGGNSFCPSKGGRSVQKGAEAPPLPLGKGGSRQFWNTENTDRVFLRYRYGKYRENTKGFIPKYQIGIQL